MRRRSTRFWATVCKTVRPMLSVRCLSVCLSCPICNVGVLWPNGCIDQDEMWHAGKPRDPGHAVLDGDPTLPPPKGGHICCGQRAGWIKMALGTGVGLGPGDFVLDGDPPPLRKKGRAPKFSAYVYCGQMAGWISMALGMEVGLSPGDFVLVGNPAPPPKGRSPQFWAHDYCGQTAGWMKTPLDTEVHLGPGHTVLEGVPAPAKGT